MEKTKCKFEPRMSKPSNDSKYYKHYRFGGLNTCIVLDNNSGCVMPNCVGYAHGRYLEEHNSDKIDWKLPCCNAEDWYIKAKDNGFEVGRVPRIGAIIVWSKGKLRFGADGAGHVAVVEKINSDGSFVVSESGYKTFMFRTSVIDKDCKLNGYKFEGFIYPKVDFYSDEPLPTTDDNVIYYKVVKGDTLWNISKKYLGSGTHYTKIVKENNLSSTKIYPNMVLKITTNK